MSDLYDRTSITPAQLIDAAQQVLAKWPNAVLHKSENTRNLAVCDVVDGDLHFHCYVGMIDLLDGTVCDFRDAT